AMIVATRQVRRGLLGTGVEVTAAVDSDDDGAVPAAPAAGRPVPGISEQDVERIMAPLRSELRAMRSMLPPMAEHSPVILQRELAALRESVAQLAGARPAETPAPVDEPSAGTVLAA